MKKLLNILWAVSLTATVTSSVVACNKPEIKNKKEEKTTQPTDQQEPEVKTKTLQKATDQQFADEIAKKINNKIIYKNEDKIERNEIVQILKDFIKEIKINKFDTSEFDKTKIKFENIDPFYMLFDTKIENVIIKYNNIKSKTKINLIINKKSENDLNKMLNTNLGEIYLENDIPSKTELVKYIKNKNISFEKITENDFDFKETPTPTSATIIGKGKYIGKVTLTYKKLVIDLASIGTSHKISLTSDFFNKQKVNVSSIQQKEVKKLVINYIIETYGNIILQLILPNINLEKDIEINFNNNNIFPFNLKEKKEIKFNLMGINNAKGKIEVTLNYSN